MMIATGIFIIVFYTTMEKERTIGYYKCTTCNKLFIPTMKEYIFSVHKLSTRKLKCTHCGTQGYCRKIMSKEE